MIKTEDPVRNMENRRTLVIVCFDLGKALDRVWQDGLISKVDEPEFGKIIIRTIENYLTRKALYIYGITSTERKILPGLPQESALSAVLYNIYTSDIPRKKRYS